MKPIIKFKDLSDSNKRSMLYEIWDDMKYVAEEIFEVRNYPMGTNITVEGIELNDDIMTVAYDVYDPCGGHGSHEIWEDIPLKYLWELESIEKERQKLWDDQMKKLRDREEQAKIDKIKSVRAEEELYLKLKKKYE